MKNNRALDTTRLAQLIGLREVAVVERTDIAILESGIPGSALRHIKYELSNDESIPALIYELANVHNLGIIISLHQHNNEYAHGKSETAGRAGHGHSAHGKALARAGFTVICPDFPGFEDRRFVNDQDNEFLAAM